jgi:hypothetical protein
VGGEPSVALPVSLSLSHDPASGCDASIIMGVVIGGRVLVRSKTRKPLRAVPDFREIWV